MTVYLVVLILNMGGGSNIFGILGFIILEKVKTKLKSKVFVQCMEKLL